MNLAYVIGKILVCIRTGAFNDNNALHATSFHATPHKNKAGIINQAPINKRYSVSLSSASFHFLNLAGVTPFHLGLATDDNNNSIADDMRFYSGNFGTASARPTLIVEYFVP